MLDSSLLDSASMGLGFDPQLSTGIARKSMIPIQRRPGAPSDDPEDEAGFLEVDDEGLFDDMVFSGELDDEDDKYGVYPVVRKSRFIESFGPTSAQPMSVPGRGEGMGSKASLQAALAGLGQ